MKDKFKISGAVRQASIAVLCLPVFFVAFCLLYNPYNIREYYSFGELSDGFHITMLACIILVTGLISAILRYFTSRKTEDNILGLIIWYICELFAAACFMALYTQLFRRNDGGWFQSLSICLKYSYSILCYPVSYIILERLFHVVKKQDEKVSAGSDEDAMVKLYDEHKRLKMTISPSNILFVRAEANYVSINYLESDRTKEYLLRSSMKGAEKSLSQYGLVRCHRSYMVNPKHVTVLAKESDGFTYATLDAAGLSKIPVSKQYCESLSALL